MAGAAHIREIALTVVIHRGGKTQFDQVCHRRKIPQDIQRSNVRVIVGLYRNRDRTHADIIVPLYPFSACRRIIAVEVPGGREQYGK